MTGVYANPDRWAATLAGWDNTSPLIVILLPDGAGRYGVAAGWTVEDGELIGDQYRDSPWREWVVGHVMALPGPDYQQAASDRYWSRPEVRAEVDKATVAGPPAELHIPLALVRSVQPFTPEPQAPSPPTPPSSEEIRAAIAEVVVGDAPRRRRRRR